MRRLVLFLAACGGSSEPPPLVDALDDRPRCVQYICFDNTIWRLQPQAVNELGFCPPPDFNGVVEAGMCEYGCRPGGVSQSIESMCMLPPKPPLACAPTGTCTQDETHSCDAMFNCTTTAITYGSCTCDQQAWTCALACNDGICGAGAMQQAIVGTWLGTMTPGNTNLAPYTVELVIDADGAWRAMSEPGTWGFGGGGTAGSTIFIEAQTSAGAYGTMRIHGYGDMTLLALRVQGSRLVGTVAPSCNTKFAFDLQRIAP